MTNEHAVAAKISPATWLGLFLSLFAMVVIRQAFAFFVPDITFALAILKETLIWASAAALIVIIRRGERLPMRSIGLGTARWWVSILWGFVIRGCVGGGGRRIGLSHWVRPRSGLRRIRETAALANYADRFSSRSSRRIILSRLCNRTAADDRAWAILVRHDSAGDFLARPLVRRRSKYSDRARGRYNLDGILSVAS
jgi:hypothetical protein